MKFRLTTRPSFTPPRQTLAPTKLSITARPLRVLDFDVEARPLSWIASDYVSKEITAIAWAWVHDPTAVSCRLLGEDDPIAMLRDFLAAYEQADLVTGHYIRGYDLPMVNGALMEHRLPVLADKMSHDTKLDLVRQAGLSMSQESLGAMLRLEHKKVQMNQSKWRAANRLTPEGLEAARERVTGDVRQHIAMRHELSTLGYLAAPKVWKSGTAKLEAYVP